VELLSATSHPDEPVAAVSEERQRLGGAEELDARAEGCGLRAVHDGGPVRGVARAVCGRGGFPELFAAGDEAEGESAEGREGAPGI